MTDHDVLAHERFRTIVAETIGEMDDITPYEDEVAAVVADFPTAYFERTVNEHGVAVRRVHVVGEWEVDPEPPKHPRVKWGDIVRYDDSEFGSHDDWEVRAVPFDAADPGDSLIFVARPEWASGKCINTSARCVQIMSRPAHPKARP